MSVYWKKQFGFCTLSFFEFLSLLLAWTTWVSCDGNKTGGATSSPSLEHVRSEHPRRGIGTDRADRSRRDRDDRSTPTMESGRPVYSDSQSVETSGSPISSNQTTSHAESSSGPVNLEPLKTNLHSVLQSTFNQKIDALDSSLLNSIPDSEEEIAKRIIQRYPGAIALENPRSDQRNWLRFNRELFCREGELVPNYSLWSDHLVKDIALAVQELKKGNRAELEKLLKESHREHDWQRAKALWAVLTNENPVESASFTQARDAYAKFEMGVSKNDLHLSCNGGRNGVYSPEVRNVRCELYRRLASHETCPDAKPNHFISDVPSLLPAPETAKSADGTRSMVAESIHTPEPIRLGSTVSCTTPQQSTLPVANIPRVCTTGSCPKR